MQQKWLAVTVLVVCGCAEVEAGGGFAVEGKSLNCGEPDGALRFDVPAEHLVLQAAIDAAEAAYGIDPTQTYTVCVSNGTYSEALSIETSNLRVVSRNGSAVTTIDASASGTSAVYIDANAAETFTMDGFTVTGGTGRDGDDDVRLCPDERDGGGIFADDDDDPIENDYTFDDLQITGNSASDDGGGIYLGGIETATLTDVVVTGNTAGSSGGGARFAMEGAIGGGSVTWTGGGVHANLVDGSFCPEVDTGHDFAGGGIGLRDGSLTLDGVDVTGNETVSTRPTIASSGGGISSFQTALTLVDLRIDDNTATYTDTGGGPSSMDHDGGGLAAVVLASGPLSLSGVTISRNAADDFGGGLALDFSGNGTVSTSNTVIELNTAGSGGGLHAESSPDPGTPIVDLLNTSVDDNEAAEEGGGMYSDRVEVRLRRVGVGTPSLTTNHAADAGGGAYLTGAAASQLVTTLANLGPAGSDNTVTAGNSDVSLAGAIECTGYGAFTTKTFTGSSSICP